MSAETAFASCSCGHSNVAHQGYPPRRCSRCACAGWLPTAPMRVRLMVTLDVDPTAWSTTYGVEPRNVRDDVAQLAGDALRAAVVDLGDGAVRRVEVQR